MKSVMLIGKILLCSAIFVLGSILGGILSNALGLPPMRAPQGTSPQHLFLAMALASPILVAGLAAIASGLGKGFAPRSGAIFLLLYVVFAMNTIEAYRFSNIITTPLWVALLDYLLPSLLTAIAVAACFRSMLQPAGLPRLTLPAWTWRLALAWIAFPLIYFFFGACIAPIVTPYYKAGVAGLRIPPIPVILQTQLLRSPMILAASLPLLALWTRSRRSLLLALGIAQACLIGLFGLAQAIFFPMVLRVTHSAEITADSFAYVALLVLLFTTRPPADHLHPSPQTTRA